MHLVGMSSLLSPFKTIMRCIHWMPHWATPPSPYILLLGPVKQAISLGPVCLVHDLKHAFAATISPPLSYAPTYIDSAMHTLALDPPDANWYMDTGALSHMTFNQGTLSFYFNLSNHTNIIVGSGHKIPIRGYGHVCISHLPLHTSIFEKCSSCSPTHQKLSGCSSFYSR